MRGDQARAVSLFERVLATANDVGLLSEEYDAPGRRMLGNFPQAFSHVGLVNSARRLGAATLGSTEPAVLSAAGRSTRRSRPGRTSAMSLPPTDQGAA
jgi:hypothetical protein